MLVVESTSNRFIVHLTLDESDQVEKRTQFRKWSREFVIEYMINQGLSMPDIIPAESEGDK